MPTKGHRPKYCDQCRLGEDSRRPRFGIECQWCGNLGEVTKPDCRYCSSACAKAHQAAQARDCRLPVLHPDPPPITRLPAKHPAVTPRRHAPLCGTVFFSGPCSWCGETFTQLGSLNGSAPLYCSYGCQKSKSRSRRGSRFLPSPKQRLRIYERDNWTCQLCDEPVDRDAHYLDDWAPTLDHITPQSHVMVPDHGDSNLRLAHRWCNSVRGDESYHTAADLAG